MGFRSDLFLAYDIRGKGITTHEAFIIGRAIGSVLNGSCFVGYDTRKDSPMLHEHLIEGLRLSGVEVTTGGLMTGPSTYFKTMNNFDFGVFITASHNPVGYNGFKIILRDGSSIDPNDLIKIKDKAVNYEFIDGNGIVRQDLTSINDYVRFLEKTFGRNDYNCVIDCLNGSTSILKGKVFDSLMKARTIHCNPLSDFGGLSPEPTESNLVELRSEVLANNADFGVGFDGDGDRSVFIDDKGRFIDGNKMTMLLAKWVVSNNAGTIVAPISVSRILESIVKPNKVKWCRVGHTFIEKELIRNNGVFGGEFSSHFYWNQFFPYSDGVFSALMVGKMINDSGKKLSELVDELPKVFVVKDEVEFESHAIKSTVCKNIINDLSKNHPNALLIDGIKFNDNNNQVLIRESLTRHTIKVFVESSSKESAVKTLNKYVNLINHYKTL